MRRLTRVRSGAWRVLVGDDARRLDASVRAHPEGAYDHAELAQHVGAEVAQKHAESTKHLGP